MGKLESIWGVGELANDLHKITVETRQGDVEFIMSGVDKKQLNGYRKRLGHKNDSDFEDELMRIIFTKHLIEPSITDEDAKKYGYKDVYDALTRKFSAATLGKIVSQVCGANYNISFEDAKNEAKN